MSLPRHDPPGFVDDLTEENKEGWSDIISSFMDTRRVNPRITPHFYDATKVKEATPTDTTTVTWIAFPKMLTGTDRQRWKKADSDRDFQDEYLEWSVLRNSSGKIVKIVFCNEGPEYFQYLASVQPDTLLDLYRRHNPGVDIQKSHLFPNGSYNAKNRWNSSTTTGTIMHLIQRANSLSAEIDLGGRATIARKRRNGEPIVDRDELARCSDFGSPSRNSDPTIGAAVNALAREGYRITIANPIGLYIHSVDWSQVRAPDGHDDDNPKDFWKWTRGKSGYYVRAEFEVPPGKGYVVGDLFVRNTPLNFAAQLADIITISIRARVSGPPKAVPVTPRFCGDHPVDSAGEAELRAQPSVRRDGQN